MCVYNLTLTLYRKDNINIFRTCVIYKGDTPHYYSYIADVLLALYLQVISIYRIIIIVTFFNLFFQFFLIQINNILKLYLYFDIH